MLRVCFATYTDHQTIVMPLQPKIRGLWPALLTPVGANGTLDSARLAAHARRMIDAGSDGITLFGTTGEGPAFTVAERQAELEKLLAAGIRADQIIVTITATALGDAIALGRHALQLGVQRQMLMPPFYYNQPHDAGVVEAFTQVIRGIGSDALRLLLYHFPAMSTYGFSHAAITELVHRHPQQVVGLKDSSGDLAHSLELTRTFPGLSILVGAEPHVASVMLAGGSGSVNGLANIAPRLMRRVMDAPDAVADSDGQCMTSLLALMGVRPNLPFVGVYKTMLAEQTGDDFWLTMRAPLYRLDEDEEQAIRQGYRALGDLLHLI
jgi:4-hydroxy-tetrahydrodipicolinate synthase